MMQTSPMSRRAFLARSAAGIAALGAADSAAQSLRMGLDPWPEAPADTAVLTLPRRPIRALQFTDLHFFRARDENPALDRKTLEELPRLIDHAKPDLLLVTGDLWHDNPDGRGAEFMHFSIDAIAALGVPWAFTWGNHDRLDDYLHGHRAFTEAAHSLYRGGADGGNYCVQIRDAAGTPMWDFFCLNSHDLGLQQAQRDWFAAHVRRDIPHAPHAFGVFHIPVAQYDTIWNDRAAAGVKFERVYLEEEDGTSLDLFQAHGAIRACFVGHDHVNDYAGAMDGIELVYGRATGHGGYGGDWVPKGAKLIVADPDAGAYEWESIQADGARWKPEPGMRIEDPAKAPWAQPG